MANRRYIDFPIASTSGDTDIILIWQDGANKQTTKATFLSGLPENLDELNDVAISGLTNGQILRYDSVTGKWENTDQGNLDLNDLNDVSIVSPSNGQVLVYNSSTSKWENSSGGYVPYTGAVTTVDLGAQQLQAGHTTLTTNGSTETLTINHTSGSGKAINVTKGGAGEGLYVNKTSGSGNAATIVGTLEATTLVKTGGTSSQFLKADGSVDSSTYGTGTVTSVGLSSATSGVTIGSSPVTTSGTITLTIATASGSQNGLLSSTDWTTFNSKQNALTNPVTGTGSAGQVAYWTGTNSQTGNSNFFWDNATGNLRVNSSISNSNLTVNGSDNTNIFTVLAGANSRLHVGTVTTGTLVYMRSQNNYGLNLGVNTSDYLTILSSGNVGINTATPATALEVNGVGLFSGGSLVGNTKNGVYIYDTVIASLAGGNSRSLQIQAQTLSIFTGTTYAEKLKVFENGNVVISTSPSDNGEKLQVSGTATFSDNVGIGTNTLGNKLVISQPVSTVFGNAGTYIGLGDTENSINQTVLIGFGYKGSSANEYPAVLGYLATNNGGEQSGALVFGTRDVITNTAPTERMRITAGGSVGVNNTSPMNSAWGTDASTKQLSIDASGYAVINLQGSTSRKYSMGVGDGSFYMCYDNTAARHNLIVTSGGNVMIGTTTDNLAGKLQVNGSITVAGGVRFSSSGADANRWSVYWNGGTGDLIVVNNISDIRAKKDFDYDIKGLETITKLKPLKFTWKDGISKSTSVSGRVRQYGFIAQETMQADDFLAWHNERHDTWGIEQYESFTAVMVKAIQELKQEIDTLKN